MAKLAVQLARQCLTILNVLSIVRWTVPIPRIILVGDETGTCEEVLDRIIHLLSPKKDQPFIELNCAAVPEKLF